MRGGGGLGDEKQKVRRGDMVEGRRGIKGRERVINSVMAQVVTEGSRCSVVLFTLQEFPAESSANAP